ncbi:MAG: hypothetical protein O4861_21790 [Trichodesmium sp. St16_bin4-tuft]|nr:hypothetical protein [Trichodesmium sp. MAG_R01]MDE5069380.1 hypothetical protein [Trichodesmium sp. St4_bin8_1]MDE5073749.1 hypothetical protein [Trichodesmium sp. St5_bin8]MDE5079658.1 hypothetical protein [Trichodesmium sp. St2_bin6]MDE5091295.1 hypothetical protein [Trichodesmium sp. St18_bin3_1_1]MDE5100820.1 hypothetical protein [Trichodesmium sp. St16_bin4-tuft]MDE5103377.1 hypothetical protein [Trichodesmium sp. St19_bin2]
MFNLKLLLYFSFFLLSDLLFLLPATAKPKVIFPVCPRSSISKLPQPPLSQTKPSIPSFWLTKDFFGAKLLETWFVNPDDTWVILVVNQLTWEKQEYMDIYKFINHFGRIAREYGYNLQICQPLQKKPIAAYFCEFQTAPLNCYVEIQSRFGSSLFDRHKKFPFPTIK